MLLERELIILWLMLIFWCMPTCKLIIFGLQILKPTSTNKAIRAILFHSGFEAISCLLTVAASGNWELRSFVVRHSEFALIDLPILKGNTAPGPGSDLLWEEGLLQAASVMCKGNGLVNFYL